MKHIFSYLNLTLCFFPLACWGESSHEATEPLTAFKARERADREVTSRYGKADLIAVMGADFDLRQREDKSIFYSTNKWIFIYKSADGEIISAAIGRDSQPVVVLAPKESNALEYIVLARKANDANFKKSFVEEVYDMTGRMRQDKNYYPGTSSFDFSSQLIDWSLETTKMPTIDGWRMDSDKVMDIAVKNGGRLNAAGGRFGGGILFLTMRNIDGQLMPLWLVPLGSSDFLVWGLEAKTGKIVNLVTNPETNISSWTIKQSNLSETDFPKPSSQLTIEVSVTSNTISLASGKIGISLIIKNPSNRSIVPPPDEKSGIVYEGYILNTPTGVGGFGYGSLYMGDPIPPGGEIQREYVLSHSELVRHNLDPGDYQIVAQFGALKSKPITIQVR